MRQKTIRALTEALDASRDSGDRLLTYLIAMALEQAGRHSDAQHGKGDN